MLGISGEELGGNGEVLGGGRQPDIMVVWQYRQKGSLTSIAILLQVDITHLCVSFPLHISLSNLLVTPWFSVNLTA